MGNYNFTVSKIPQKGQIVRIVHDEYSKFQEIPNDIMKIGQQAQVIDTKNLYKSRPNFPDISVSRVKFKDGTVDTYMTKNLQF